MQTLAINYNDPKYHCLCNIHVEKGAQLLAIVGTVFSGLALVGCLLKFEIVAAMLQLPLLLPFLAILYAQKWRRPVFYLPYLILQALDLALWVSGCLTILIMAAFGVTVIPSLIEKWGEGSIDLSGLKSSGQIVVAIGAVCVSTVLLICIYLYSVIFRAWRYMRHEQFVRGLQISTCPQPKPYPQQQMIYPA